MLSHHFNQKIKKNVLPNNLVYLKIGIIFNKKIKKGIFPIFIKHMKFIVITD